MAAILLRIEPGDEVIVPSFTFVSTVNAFVLRGARPVFADIRPDTLNIEISKRHSISMVEDDAHGLFGENKGKYLGTLGALATLSFHETKNFTCGEGGALIVKDPDYVQRAEIIREKGTNRSRFFRGKVAKYTPGWTSGRVYRVSNRCPESCTPFQSATNVKRLE